MTTFGTSAYLKLLALNPQPRDTALRRRIWSNSDRPYDFHKAMRRIASEFAGGTTDWLTTKARLKAIKQSPERKSAIAAAFALRRWVDGRTIRFLDHAVQRVFSPNEVFSIKFSPDFEIDIEGRPTQVHIWNTKKPPLRLREAIGTLGLFLAPEAPQSIAVLSLGTGELFLPSDYKGARDLARLLAVDIETRFTRISEERGRSHPKKPSEEKRIAP